ncbi:MAG: hypothetical protein AB8H03_14305 [Saprospiraceae bacterium]
MKTLIYFSSLTFFVFLTYFSCKQNSKIIQKDYSLENASEIIDNFNQGKPPHEMATYKKASIEIVTTKKEVVLFVKEANKQDQMYFLQQEPSNQRNIIRETIASAEILFFKRHLLINATDKDLRFYFSIDETIPNYLSNLDVGVMSNGFGLVQQKGFRLSYDSMEDFHDIPSIYTVIKRPVENQANIRTDGEGGTLASNVSCGCCTGSTAQTVCVDVEQGNCDSGGAGSSSCTITLEDGSSCSTTCTGNSESCCNDTSNDG